VVSCRAWIPSELPVENARVSQVSIARQGLTQVAKKPSTTRDPEGAPVVGRIKLEAFLHLTPILLSVDDRVSR